ncbi:MAG: very short patch repair endonuclease [Candidatus Cloacimonetes bacterium]|jgi:DNA mismatch endonuclease (patch repair protein)|nr:very short patch repair endonuclease [Candidatus Cloacimonadota bacterium]MDY0367425.1 very short patch repair endonuclease [Candidatus Syntrophosphaera sp.]
MPDNLTPEQRSYCMSRIKSKDTGLEMRVRSALHRRGLRFRKHVKDLPGKPDVVFRKARIAVFVDGDFWHGYGFSSWEEKVSDFWKKKINKNRERDAANHRKLGQMGWTVIRLWQHEIEEDFDACIDRILAAVCERKKEASRASNNHHTKVEAVDRSKELAKKQALRN